jgi:hypothetical protein
VVGSGGGCVGGDWEESLIDPTEPDQVVGGVTDHQAYDP